MYLGRIVELGVTNNLYEHPIHPYTQALLSAIPMPDPDKEAVRQRILLEGDVPSPANPPSGCRFHTRCSYATDVCREVDPEYRDIAKDGAPHWVACHHAEQFL
jgi:oligopeptide/dipeptide ABC transporter ATP-binding protein